jgi:TetR/AcrR family transcriptional repressor of nem operon
MKSVGLTHGGFYAHFKSRDELVAVAIRTAGAETADRVFAEAHSLDETLRAYLSMGHLEHPATGCAVAALGGEGARQALSVRRALAHVAKSLLGLVERKLHPRRRAREVSDEALRLAATMVGAVVLGRLVEDRALAERILRAAHQSALS